MAIHAIVGLPGMGKTLYGVHMLRRVKGRRRLSNLFPRGSDWEFCLWDEIISTGHATVLIDEAHMWFGSRGWEKTMQEELMPWQQHRKQGLDLWYTVQGLGQIDKQIRALTAHMHLVKKMGNWVIVTSYWPDELDKPNAKHYKRRVAYITPGDYNSYWTEQLVGDKLGKGYDLGRLARLPAEAPKYQGRKGWLRGPSLRYVMPSHYVILAKEGCRRFEWKSARDVLSNLALMRSVGFTVGTSSYAIRWQLDAQSGMIQWTQGDYLECSHPHALAVQAGWADVVSSPEVDSGAARRIAAARAADSDSERAKSWNSSSDLDRLRDRTDEQQNLVGTGGWWPGSTQA